MKQSNNKKSRDVTAFLYERLSRDDNLEGESYSIGNQKKLLAKVAKEKGYTNLVHFLDDGISGVTMDRPGFVEMICQLEQGKAAAVFVKDLSRLGRNYIEVGRLTEEFFPNHDIRLVAVSDNIDTAEGENELAPIRNLFNEWYARDISKKRRISNKIKGNAGEPMGQPPYGYIKDPNDPKDKPDDHLEKTYLTQMQAAYADHLHKPINCSDDLPQTCRPEYAKQREYFYDAEGMRRNLRDVIENGEQEFDALKVDLYDGICDTCASDYADGLLRMRATLSQAAGFPLSGSVIAQFPSMIKAAEKKGLCHMLVNDHMLEWVHENE